MKAAITGATSGIGKQIARYLHSLGYDLILTGRNQESLNNLKKEFKDKAEIINLDLSIESDVYKFYDFCKEKSVDFLVNNAGFGVFGEFTQTPLERELKLIDLNIKALHILTKLFLVDFEKKGKGIILNVASSAGFMYGPLLSSYYASKNYVVALTMAIYEELRRKKSPIKISALCPGPVDTNFNENAGVKFSIKPISAEYVAKYAIDQTLKGKTIIVPSISMKMGVCFSKFLPKKFLTKLAYNIQKKKFS